MSAKTSIEWTDRTWNPIRGCTRVSEGCRNCYAEGFAARFSVPPLFGQNRGAPFEGFAEMTGAGPRWTGKVALVPEMLDAPLRWWKPQRVFVNSMSDLFHEKLHDEEIAAVFGVMALAPQHTFQILTKRAGRMREWLALKWSRGALTECLAAAYIAYPRLADRWPLTSLRALEAGNRGWPLPNVWLGVSVENQEAADERIPLLLQTPAAIRFLSVEPLLGPVDLTRHLGCECGALRGDGRPRLDLICPLHDRREKPTIDWVIVGGESGPGARPSHPDWSRSIRDQSIAAGTRFLFKQHGAWAAFYDRDREDPDWKNVPQLHPTRERWVNLAGGHGFHGDRVVAMRKVGKKAAGRVLDGRTWDQLPSRP